MGEAGADNIIVVVSIPQGVITHGYVCVGVGKGADAMLIQPLRNISITTGWYVD